MVNRVFECDPPDEWNGKRKLFLRGVVHGSAAPDLYLIALDSGNVGEIDRQRAWTCDQGSVLSFSDGNGKQQVLVLLPAYGWFETATGTRYVLPRNGRSSEAVLVQR